MISFTHSRLYKDIGSKAFFTMATLLMLLLENVISKTKVFRCFLFSKLVNDNIFQDRPGFRTEWIKLGMQTISHKVTHAFRFLRIILNKIDTFISSIEPKFDNWLSWVYSGLRVLQIISKAIWGSQWVNPKNQYCASCHTLD